MATKMINREELKQKVTDRVIESIERYAHSAERGIEEIEKEVNLLHLKVDNTELEANDRMMMIMVDTVVLSCYALEIEKQS